MSFHLDEYWCSLPPPTPRLWRVLQDTTQSHEDSAGNIFAQNNNPPLQSEQDLKNAVQNHMRWAKNSSPSCFLSTFCHWTEARKWAQWQQWKDYKGLGQKNVEILLIDTSELIRLTNILLPSSIRALGQQPAHNEVLVLRFIPASAVLARVRLDNIKEQDNPPTMEPWHSRYLPYPVGFVEESEDEDGDASSKSDVHNRVAEEQRLLDANLELESLSGAVASLNICGAGALAASVDATEELDEPHDPETSEDKAQETKKSSLPIEGPAKPTGEPSGSVSSASPDAGENTRSESG